MVGHFTAHTQSARELCQLTWSGNIVPRDQQTMFCCAVAVDCRTADKTIDVGFVFHFEAELSRLRDLDPQKCSPTVAYHGANDYIPRLAKYGPWELYGTENLPIPGDDALCDASNKNSLELDTELGQSVQDFLVDATKRHAHARDAFERAKEFLESNINWIHRSPTEAIGAARFLAECMRNDARFYMGAWNDEKSAKLVGAVGDLIRRKNSAHTNYRRRVDQVRSVLYSIDPPRYWRSWPSGRF
jgi:hypothetical protein